MELALMTLVLAVLPTRTFMSDTRIEAVLGDEVCLVGMCAVEKQKP